MKSSENYAENTVKKKCKLKSTSTEQFTNKDKIKAAVRWYSVFSDWNENKAWDGRMRERDLVLSSYLLSPIITYKHNNVTIWPSMRLSLQNYLNCQKKSRCNINPVWQMPLMHWSKCHLSYQTPSNHYLQSSCKISLLLCYFLNTLKM